MDEVFQKNSSFHVKEGTIGKIQFLFFSSFLVVLKKFSVWEKDLARGYNSIDIFMTFPNFLNLKSFGNSWGNTCISCLLLKITVRWACGTIKTWSNIKVTKYYEHDYGVILTQFSWIFLIFFWNDLREKIPPQREIIRTWKIGAIYDNIHLKKKWKYSFYVCP